MNELTDQIRNKEQLLKIPETGDGFDISLQPYADGIPVRSWFQEGESGDYRICVRLRAINKVKECFLFAGRKALMWRGALEAGEVVEKICVTNLSKIIPRYYDEPMVMKYVCVSLAAETLEDIEMLCIEAEYLGNQSLKHIWLCGDSTVTDQSSELPYHPGACYSAWGQMLPAYLREPYVVSNHAHCGLTTETFRQEGHYAVIEEYICPGDFIWFQFGHNDQKLPHLMADTGYRRNLIRYIEEAREKKAWPVLVTPLARNSWKPDHTYHDLLEEYADMVHSIGREFKLPVLDLHRHSMELLQNNGFEGSKCWFHPGDMTHTNDYGAYKMAGFIGEELKASGLDKQFDMLKKTIPDTWDAPCDLWEQLRAGTNNRRVTAQQKEQFDHVEKSAENLVRIIEEAKKNQ